METLDKDVVNIAKAIRQTESGGDFKAKGKSGEFGAYQFTPGTWNSIAPKYGISSKLENATPEEQNQVVYKRIKSWKDSGKNIGQVASMWNAGEGEPDAYLGKFSDGREARGTNKFGVKYDVPTYAKSVATAYQTIKSGGQAGQDPNNPSSVGVQGGSPNSDGFIRTTSLPTHQNPISIESPREGILGTNPNDDTYGKIIDNSITRGIRKIGSALTFGGSEELGDVNSSIKDRVIGAGKVGVGIAGITGLGRLATGALRALKGTRALSNPAIENIMIKGFRMAPGEFQTLSNTEKLNALTEALKNGVVPSNKLLLQKAIEEITPKAAHELGVTTGLIRNAIKRVAGGGWKAVLSGLAGKEVIDVLKGKDGE